MIVALDGVQVPAPGAIFRLLDRTRIAKECQVQFLRDGSAQTAAILPNERPQP